MANYAIEAELEQFTEADAESLEFTTEDMEELETELLESISLKDFNPGSVVESFEVKLMNPKRLFLGLLIATLVLPPLAALKPASARTLTTADPKANLIAQGGAAVPQINIDPVGIGQVIDNAVRSAKNRDACVKGLMEAAVPEANKGGYNVMVFNMRQGYETDIRNTAVFFKQVNCDGIPYGVWIFDTGTFTNQGDGGFINWAFYGTFKREGKDGKTVIFN